MSGGQGAFAPERRLLTIGLLGLVTAAAFEGMAVPTVLPATVSDLGGLNLYGWAFSAFWLTNIIGITLAGSDADRRGPGRALAVGVVLFAAGMVVSGLANAMPMVIVGRAIQGFGSGRPRFRHLRGDRPRLSGLDDAAHDRADLERVGHSGLDRSRARRVGDRLARLALGLPRRSCRRCWSWAWRSIRSWRAWARRSAPRFRCAATRAAPSTRCAWQSDRRCCWRR